MSAAAGHIREYFRVGPANRDHLPALRVAIGVAVPLLTLLAIDRTDLAIYAIFGAFTGIYGRGETHQRRLGHQLRAGSLLLANVLAGIGLSLAHPGPWALVCVIAVATAADSLLADALRLRPSGPFFALFALAACASIPLSAPAWQAAAACLASLLLSVVIGFAGWLRHRVWAARRPLPPAGGNARTRAQLIHALRYLLAVLGAGVLALLTGLGHTYWAMLAAAIPLAGASMGSRISRGISRVVGTFAGIGVTALLLVPHFGGWQLILIVVLLQFGAEMFVIRHYGLALLFITPLALLMTELAHPSAPGPLMLDRGLETLIGAAVGIAVVLALPDRRRAA
ncbi:FUSC family protein [Paenarthrobacter sp. DKR-5]|uniref:FUSC family protein n=1 Tax=Paenarthrobacter sp. DKR-5 TaxID=2835535 RepID=UPI001BDDBFB3|nr:FUSC family protein [Paenarthrobacter sp. DKR-5]MBT1003487.1 FUSC family protein [Paenarthrobacter sp. DKR-5]